MDTHLFQKIGACMLLSFASLFSYAEKLPLQVEMNLQNGAINQLKVEKDKTEMNWLIKTDFLREMGGYYYQPYAWTSDHITAFKAAADGGVANMQDIGFMYRENRQSITTNTSNTKEKISAMLSAKAWYNEFLKKVPDDNDIDRIYYKLILKELDFHINRRIAYDLSERLRKKSFDIFYWILNKNKYGLNMQTIITACAFALKKLIR